MACEIDSLDALITCLQNAVTGSAPDQQLPFGVNLFPEAGELVSRFQPGATGATISQSGGQPLVQPGSDNVVVAGTVVLFPSGSAPVPYQVTITASYLDAAVQLSIEAVPSATQWQFAGDYPPLPRSLAWVGQSGPTGPTAGPRFRLVPSFFNQLTFDGAQYAATPGTTALSFQGSLDLTTGPLSMLAGYLRTDSIGVSGSVIPRGATFPMIALDGPIKSFAVPNIADLSVGLALGTTAATGPTGGSYAQLAGDVTIAGFPLHLSAPLLQGDSDWVFAITTENPEQYSLGNLTGLTEFAGNQQTLSLPQGLSVISSFYLSQVQISVDPSGPSATMIGFTVQTPPSVALTAPIVGLSLTGLAIQWNVINPFNGPSLISVITGTLVLGNSPTAPRLNGSVTFSGQKDKYGSDVKIEVELDPAYPVSLAALFQQLSGLSLDVDLVLSDLKLEAYTGPRTLQFVATLAGDWPLPVPSVQFQSGVQFIFNYAPNSITGSMVTNLTIAGLTFLAQASYPVPGAGWNFGAWLRPESQGTTLQQMINNIFPGWPTLPAGLGSIALQRLDVTVNTKTKAFSFDGALTWPFEFLGQSVIIDAALLLDGTPSAGSGSLQYSGAVSGALTIGSLVVGVIYAFDVQNNTTITFQIAYKGVTLTCVYSKDSDGDAILTVNLGGVTFGGIVEYLVNLVDPSLNFSLSSPWTVLNEINFDNLTLTINLDTEDVGITYTFPDGLDLVFITVDTISLTYTVVAGERTVVIDITGDFFDQDQVSWDLLNDPPPGAAGVTDSLFDVQFLALGHNLTFTSEQTFLSIADAINAMQSQFTPPSEEDEPPLENVPGLVFSGAGNWMVGVQLSVLGGIAVAVVFNDPDLFGLQISLEGPEVDEFAGLDFEILYAKVTDTIGVWAVDLTLPEAMRHITFGPVEITLPDIGIDVYTNGNFEFDFGFPYNGDFSDSMAVEVAEFTGLGGFYVARLDASTALNLPVITNGTFSPVTEFGVGLSIGIDLSADSGMFEAGASLLLEAIVQGTLAWFRPTNGALLPPARYYNVTGTAGLVASVFGSINLVVIKISVSVSASATFTLLIEAYEPIDVQMTVDVDVQASVKVLFITIPFSFSHPFSFSFTLGEASTPPWIVAAPDTGNPATLSAARRLRSQRGRHRRRRMRALPRLRTLRELAGSVATFDWSPRPLFDAIQAVPLIVTPALTVAASATGPSPPPVQVVMTLFAQNAVAPGARSAAEVRERVIAGGATAPFVTVAQGMLRWAASSVEMSVDPPPSGTITVGELDALASFLATPSNRLAVFNYPTLAALFAQNFKFRLSSPIGASGFHLPGSDAAIGATAETQATVFPMIPDLQMAPRGLAPVAFNATACATAGYVAALETYYDQLRVPSGATAATGATAAYGPMSFGRRAAAGPGCPAGTESLSSIVFGDYFALVTKQVVQEAIALMGAYPYEATGKESLAGLENDYGAAPMVVHRTRRDDSLATLAHELRVGIRSLRAANPWLRGVPARRRLPAGSSVLYAAGPSVETIAEANQNYPLNPAGPPLPLTGVQYQVKSGDTLGTIAAAFGLAGPALLTGQTPANSTNPALPATGNTMVIPEFTYTVTPNDVDNNPADPVSIIAARLYVRLQPPPAPHGELAWYIGAIGAANPSMTATPWTIPGATVGPDGGLLQTGATTRYFPAPYDTVPLVAEMFELLQLDPAVPAAFAGTITYQPPAVAGTTLTIPQQTYAIPAGQSFVDIARLFFAGPTAALPGIAAANTATPNLLTPLTVMVLPQIDYGPTGGDTLATVAAKMDLTLDDLAGQVQGVTGIFAPYAVTNERMTIPDVASRGIDQLAVDMVTFGSFNTLGAMTSRYLLHGMRVPKPGGAPQSLFGLYEVDGQQFPLPVGLTNGFDVTFTSGTTASWICFEPPPGTRQASGPTACVESLTVTIGPAFLDRWAPSPKLDPQIVSGPAPMPLYADVPPRYPLEQMIAWQAATTVLLPGPTGAPAGQPSLWMFPDTLLAAMQQATGATAAYELVTLSASGRAQPQAQFTWATAVPVEVSRTQSAYSAPLLNTYVIDGSDADGIQLLLSAWSYLLTTNAQARLYLLYSPSAASDNPSGLISDRVATESTFVLKTNLTTVTQSPGSALAAVTAPVSGTYYAGLDAPGPFLQFVWEASITGSGGFYLQYTNADGGSGLPTTLFASSSSATIWLLLILGSQADPIDPDRQIYPFNNCAVVGANLDASSVSLAAQLASPSPGDLKRVPSVAPGNIGFVLQRLNPQSGPTGPTTDTQNLYSLLGYRVEANQYFARSNEGSPVGPLQNPSSATGATAGLYWTYQQLVPVAQFGLTGTGPTGGVLPDPGQSPYRGLAGPTGGTAGPRSYATLSLAFHDIYGNTTESTTPLPPLDVPFGYTDAIVGAGSWPGSGFQFQFAPGPTGPSLQTSLSLHATRYIANPSIPYAQAVSQAATDTKRWTQIFYQINQPDLSYTLASNLGTPQADRQDVKAAMNAYVMKALLFAETASALEEQTFTNPATQTLAGIAALLNVTAAALAAANPNLSAVSLFATQYVVPLIAVAAPGNTLTQLAAGQSGGAYPPFCTGQATGGVTRRDRLVHDRRDAFPTGAAPVPPGATGPPLTVAELAQNNISQPLTPGITIFIAPQTFALPATFTTFANTLAAVAATLQCNVYNEVPSPGSAAPVQVGLVPMNWTTPSIVPPRLPVTIQGKKVVTTATTTFSSLFAAFSSLELTEGEFASAIANVSGIFSPGATVAYNDLIVPPSFALANVSASAGSVAQLAGWNAVVPNFYVESTPVYISFSCASAGEGDTLASLAQDANVTLAQFAEYNASTAVNEGVQFSIPNLTAFNGTAGLYAAYEPQPNDSLASIAATFGDVQTIAALNRNVRGIFATGSSIGAGVTATAADSLQTAFLRFRASDPGLDFTTFVTQIAPVASIYRQNGAMIVPLPSVPANVSIDALAASMNVDGGAAALLAANQSLQGFVFDGSTWSLSNGSSVTAGPYDTIDTLLARFPPPAPSIADLAAANGGATGLLTAGSPLLLPPSATNITCNFVVSPDLAVIFPILVSMEMTRAPGRVAPDFAQTPAVFFSSSALSPATGDGTGTSSLRAFAASFESAFQSLKCATTAGGSVAAPSTNVWAVNFGSNGIASVAIQAQAPQFYALAPLSTSPFTGNVSYRPYFRGRGLCARVVKFFKNVDLDAWMQQFLSTVDLVLTPPYAIPAFQFAPGATGPVGLTGMTGATGPTGATTSTPPAGCTATPQYGSQQFDALVAAKQSIASTLSTRVLPIVNAPGVDGYYTNAAAGTLYQQMLVSLASGYSVSAIVQFPVEVDSPFTSPTGATGPYAPRLSGKFVPDLYTLPGVTVSPPASSIAAVAAQYQVSPAWLAQVLAGMPNLLQSGIDVLGYTVGPTATIGSIASALGATGPSWWNGWSSSIDEFDTIALFQPRTSFALSYATRSVEPGDSLTTFANYFNLDAASVARANAAVPDLVAQGAAVSVWNNPGVVYTAPGPQSLQTTLAGLNALLPANQQVTLDQMAFAVAENTDLLSAGSVMNIVQPLPAMSISTSKVSLGPVSGSGAAPPIAFLLTVKNEADVRKVILNLDYVATQMEFGIASVPNAGNYLSSSWLTFVLPIGATGSAPVNVQTSVPQVQVPLPLRSSPTLPALLAQSATPHVPNAPSMTAARLWDYSFDFTSNPAAQDTEHVVVTFSNGAAPPASSFTGPTGATAGLVGWLAAFNEAYPSLKNDLALLTRDGGNASMTAAFAVQTLTSIATGVAAQLATSIVSAGPAGVSGPNTYSYEVDTFGDTVYLRTLQLVQQGPVGASALWPQIFVAVPPMATGPSGISGATGGSGPTGMFSATSGTGPTSVSGTTGLWGPTSTTGTTGATGSNGPIGFIRRMPAPRPLDAFRAVHKKAHGVTGPQFTPLTNVPDEPGLYLFPPSVPENVPLTYRYVFPQMDVIQDQDAWAGVYVDRNATLIANGPLGLSGSTTPILTNPAFIYQTPLVQFIDPATPLIDDPAAIDVSLLGPSGPTCSLTTHVAQMLGTALGNAAQSIELVSDIQILCSYGFNLVSTSAGALVAASPIRLVPITAVGPVSAAEFVDSLVASLALWRMAAAVPGNGGMLLFDLTVFAESAATPHPYVRPTVRGVPLRFATGATSTPPMLPVLRLSNLQLPMNTIQWPPGSTGGVG